MEDCTTLDEKTSLVWTFRGVEVSRMPDWETAVGLLLSGSALFLLILTMTKYRESRSMRFSVYCLLTASAGFRLLRGLQTGAGPSWLEALAVVFFGAGAVMEAVSLYRQKSARKD